MSTIPLIPIQKAAEQLGVSRQWIYTQVSKGTFKLHHIGSKSFLHVDDIIQAARRTGLNETAKEPLK